MAGTGQEAGGSLLIRDADLPGVGPGSLRLRAGRIAECGRSLAGEGEPVLEARGGALLPGLHDHHIHLHALAAALDSVRCGPPQVRDRAGLARALSDAPRRQGWLRGVGYHESVAGPLDRAALDALAGPGPVRVQHRSGALWMLNYAAVDALGLERGADAPGVERDATGRATGRLLRADRFLRERLPRGSPPELARVGRLLTRFGVTGVTDASLGNGAAELDAFEAQVGCGALPQALTVMGAADLPEPAQPGVARGAVKIVLLDHDLPAPEALEAKIRGAHEHERAVAIHCVTRAELVLAASALAAAGARAGDRIEHASVAPPELVAQLAALGTCIVTQPGFIRERGDSYRTDVEQRDQPWLYRGRGFLEANLPLGGGTDAPFGEADPWLAMQAAVDRRSASGAVLGADEGLDPERALALFTTPADAPGGEPRRLAPGEPADLCLLRVPWSRARDALSSDLVAATIRAGRLLSSD